MTLGVGQLKKLAHPQFFRAPYLGGDRVGLETEAGVVQRPSKLLSAIKRWPVLPMQDEKGSTSLCLKRSGFAGYRDGQYGVGFQILSWLAAPKNSHRVNHIGYRRDRRPAVAFPFEEQWRSVDSVLADPSGF